MKVVINKCFGGFGLSAMACIEIAKLKWPNQDLFMYKYLDKKYKRYKLSPEFKLGTDDYCSCYLITNKDLGSELDDINSNDVIHQGTFDDQNIDLRSDRDLIAVVQSLGNKANGYSSELRVIDIPDDVDAYITDYDGIEAVEERHRIWR